MMIERFIYEPSELSNECSNIQIHISPTSTSYTLYVIGISVNDGVFSIKIDNVDDHYRVYLEKACMLILNTIHITWMPSYICKDMIDDGVTCRNLHDFSSEMFASILDVTVKPHQFAHLSNTVWLSGEIIQNDGALAFIWEKPPYHVYDDGDTLTGIKFNLILKALKGMQQRIAPHGFKYPDFNI
jgi:hypothetical protein